MEATTRETAFLIEKLIDRGLDPLRREGIHTDAAARRVLRCSSTNIITNCCFGCDTQKGLNAPGFPLAYKIFQIQFLMSPFAEVEKKMMNSWTCRLQLQLEECVFGQTEKRECHSSEL